jgi:hypothetical protein
MNVSALPWPATGKSRVRLGARSSDQTTSRPTDARLHHFRAKSTVIMAGLTCALIPVETSG